MSSPSEGDKKASADYCGKGCNKLLSKDYEGALQDLNQAVKFNPDNYAAYWLARQFEAALKDCDKAIELNYGSAQVYTRRASAKQRVGERRAARGAISDYDMAIELEPDNALAYSFRGECHRTVGNTAQAKADFKKAKELNPDFEIPAGYAD